MEKILDVYFHEKIIGQLIQDNHGEMICKRSRHAVMPACF